MSDSPQDFDLKFLPDWLKETPCTNRYADYEGDSGDRPRRDRDDRRGAPRGNRPPDRRGPRPPQGDRPRGPRPPGDRPRGDAPRGDRRGDKRPFDRRGGPQREAPRPAPTPAPAEVRVEFLPEPNAAAGIARQIKSSGRAYAVFSTAKLFLERPERHRVRVTSAKAEAPLFQIGDGPISFDRAAVERGAFHLAKDEFYAEETVQGEPIKGNFSNVARCRANGVLLGPTNHHGYQPALRKLYEERFSRRMSFQEFQQQEIEIVTNEQAVADWKEQARTSTTYTTKKETEPVTFRTMFDAEQHFRKHYLPELVKSGTTLECDGPASRANLDRHVSAAVRAVWEQERVFPQGIVNGLRRFFGEVGLHYFKHRKRILHVSGIKPVRHAADQPFSDGITAILKTVEAQPRIKRPELAKRLLGAQQDAPDAAERKEQLAADVHYLIHAGHLLEFADGALDLPLGPKGEQPLPQKNVPVSQESASASSATGGAEVPLEGETAASPEEAVGMPDAVLADLSEKVEEFVVSEFEPAEEPLPVVAEMSVDVPAEDLPQPAPEAVSPAGESQFAGHVVETEPADGERLPG